MSILLIDIDGTLVGKTNSAPESAIKAIRQARENGHLVYLCTGRSKAEIYPDLLSIGIDGILGGNGSYIEDHGEIIFHQTLSQEEAKAIVDWLDENNLPFYLEANSGLYPSKTYKEEVARLADPFLTNEGLRKFLDGMVDTSEYNLSDYYRDDLAKISYLLPDERCFQAASEKFPHLKQNRWSINTSAKHGDIGVAKIDKKVAIQKLLDHLGAKAEDLIAFGDEPVDIPMFEIAGKSVAMGSGAKEAKEAADYVTTATDEDGLYNAFKHFSLI